MKTIGIVGSRRRDTASDYRLCLAKFREIYELGDKVVSGGCPKGGDRFAEIIARKFGITITIHHADWETNGKSAGFIRNTFIARDCTILLAVVSDDRKGGTEDTIKKVKNLHKEIILI